MGFGYISRLFVIWVGLLYKPLQCLIYLISGNVYVNKVYSGRNRQLLGKARGVNAVTVLCTTCHFICYERDNSFMNIHDMQTIIIIIQTEDILLWIIHVNTIEGKMSQGLLIFAHSQSSIAHQGTDAFWCLQVNGRPSDCISSS